MHRTSVTLAILGTVFFSVAILVASIFCMNDANSEMIAAKAVLQEAERNRREAQALYDTTLRFFGVPTVASRSDIEGAILKERK